MRIENYRRSAVWAVTILAAVLRLAWLDHVPPAINQDEAIHAWEANCLLHTGKDHSGASWPVFCHAFGKREAHSSPFIYLLIPFQAILGMNVWSTRLPGAIFGTAAVPLLYWLVRDWYGVWCGIVAALLLAISPWHVHLSRLAFEVSICPTMLIAGMLLFSRGIQFTTQDTKSTERSKGKYAAVSGKAVRSFVLSGAILGLLLWTYNAYRVFLPLLMGAGLLLYLPDFVRFAKVAHQRRTVFLFAAGFLIGMAPFIWGCIHTPEKAWGHAAAEFVGNRTQSVQEAVRVGFTTYLLQLSPDFLFQRGDPSIVQCVPGHGELYWICAALLVLGIVRVILRWRVERLGRFLIVWLILAPIPAGLTILTAGHTLRAATALPAYQILSAIGLIWIVERAFGRSRIMGFGTISLATVCLAFFAARFFNLFFRVYPIVAAPFFWSEGRSLVAEIMKQQASYDLVLITPTGCGQNGSLFVFWSGMTPRQYFEADKNIWEGPEWDVLLQVDKYFFVGYEQLPRLVAQLPPEMKQVRVLVAERPGVRVQGEVLQRYNHPHGQEALVLYDVMVHR